MYTLNLAESFFGLVKRLKIVFSFLMGDLIIGGASASGQKSAAFNGVGISQLWLLSWRILKTMVRRKRILIIMQNVQPANLELSDVFQNKQ